MEEDHDTHHDGYEREPKVSFGIWVSHPIWKAQDMVNQYQNYDLFHNDSFVSETTFKGFFLQYVAD